MHRDKIREAATKHLAEYDIRATSIDTPVGTLSGGNQQKVIVARELGREVRLLIGNQPTRGLDVGSIEFVHQQIVAARDEGTAVLIFSTELDEIYALSDRIVVMYGGRIAGVRPPSVSVEEIGLLMTGAGTSGASPEAQPA
jgi:simple sugar transport system ATP-binding protein